jgi:hypothetical protein
MNSKRPHKNRFYWKLVSFDASARGFHETAKPIRNISDRRSIVLHKFEMTLGRIESDLKISTLPPGFAVDCFIPSQTCERLALSPVISLDGSGQNFPAMEFAAGVIFYLTVRAWRCVMIPLNPKSAVETGSSKSWLGRKP